jgi:hypothetical protein
MRRSTVGKLLFAGVLLIAAGNGCGNKSTLPRVKLKPGSLEFCIVANDIDDDIAIAEAKDFFEKALHDPKLQSELKQAAEEGKPPPPPRSRGLRFFFNGHDTTFRWVELDRKMVDDLKFEQPDEFNKKAKEVTNARANGAIALVGDELFKDGNFKPNAKYAIWSRTCIDKSLSLKDRAAKSNDYFILLRESERGKEISEAQLENIEPGKDKRSELPHISITLNKEGGKRMRELTKENEPTERQSRGMAIIVEGKVLNAPLIHSVLGEKLQISGVFTQEYVDELVNRIRATEK